MRVTITTSSTCEPTVHKEGCRDLGKVRKRSGYVAEYTMDAESLAEIAEDFWSDIIHSDLGLAAGSEEAIEEALRYIAYGDPYVAPCVDLPERKEG